MSAGAYWPWWLGAVTLATVTVTYRYITGLPLGISGTVTRLLHWRQDTSLRESEQVLRELTINPAALEEELMRATQAHFSQNPVSQPHASESASQPSLAEGATCVPPAELPMVRPSAVQNLLLILMVALGGGLSAALAGRWAISTNMGATFENLLAGGWMQLPVLLAGGILVGAGTRMAGGCSSGHGLSGCSQLHSNSLVATAAFFGAGASISLLLKAVAP